MEQGFVNISEAQRQFDDPFLLPSSKAMPTTLASALDLCLFMWILNPEFRQASSNIARYFVTDLDYPDKGSTDEKNDWDDLLQETLMVMQFLTEIGDEYSCYGNAFARIHFPFDRYLVDKDKSTLYALDLFPPTEVKFNIRDLTYEVTIPGTKTRKKLPFRDQKSTRVDRIRLRKLNPRFMLLQHSLLSGKTSYIYRFEPEMLADVKLGRLHVVNEMPLPMLTAIRDNQDFIFNEDQIFHFKAPTISGISNNGWGIPPTVTNFRNLHHLQVFRKIDEAVGMDYMLPFRLFSPMPAQGINDQIQALTMGRWTQEIGSIIDNRRKDKHAMHALPFPINYQEFGANGKTLTPKDIMEFQISSTLEGAGYPRDLFTGGLQYLQIPTTLRLFENSWLFMHVGFNKLIQWISHRVSTYLGRKPMKVTLQRPSMADSMERKQFVFQLAAMGEISRETAYHMLGIDNVRGEVKKRMEEDMDKEKLTATMQQELQTAIQNGTIAAPEEEESGGSLPGQGAEGQATTPMGVQQNADDLANYWLSIPDQGARRQAMTSVSSADPQLYAMAKEVMERKRRAGESQGRQAVNQQAQQGGAPEGQ